MYCIYFGCGPLPVTVTTRIITFSVGEPYKHPFTTVTWRGPHPTYTYSNAANNIYVYLLHLHSFYLTGTAKSIAEVICKLLLYSKYSRKPIFSNNDSMMEVEKNYFEGTSSTKPRFVIPWLLNWESVGYAHYSYYLGEFTIAQGPPPYWNVTPTSLYPFKKTYLHASMVISCKGF